MDVRHYHAESVSECLSQVRSELGREAVIIQVNQHKGPTIPRARRIEVLASPPEEAAPAPNLGRSIEEAPTDAPKANSPEDIINAMYAVQNKKGGTTLGSEYADRAPYIATREPEPPAEAYHMTDMLVDDLDGAVPEEARMTDELRDLARYFLDTGINREITSELVWRISQKFRPSQHSDRERIHEYLNSLIQGTVACGGWLERPKRGKKRTVAVIGPTGVGKTTTIAKIATSLVAQDISVGLIVLDNFRVGAVDQLRKYAKAIDVPLLAASNELEFRKVHSVLSGKQVILVDTAGQNPHDRLALERLQLILGAVKDVEKQLVLSANTKERDMAAFTDIYKQMNFSSLIFTKIDESLTFGGLLNVYFQSEKPISYLCAGQRVPDDLEKAEQERLATLLFQ